MPETKKTDDEAVVGGRYYYDDSTGYEEFDPESEHDDAEIEPDQEITDLSRPSIQR